MSISIRSVIVVVALATLSILVSRPVAGQPPADDRAAPKVTPSEQIRMPVRVVAGRLVVRCELATRFRRMGANLWVDYERPCGLELHNRAADWIGVDRDGGVPVSIRVPGGRIVVDRRAHGDEEAMEDFTRLYSRELGETAILGTIGAEVLARYHATFDLHGGFLFLRSPSEAGPPPPAAGTSEVVTSITIQNNQVWLPVRLSDGRRMALALGTSQHDTIVDELICEEFDAPAGAIGAVQVGTIDIGSYVALRPEELIQVHTDGALGTSGLNLLQHLKVEVDRVQRWARITESAPAEFPVADRAFFEARVEDEPAALQAFLEKHPGTRLAREAAQLLLELLLDTNAPAEKFGTALEWLDKTRIDDLRTTEALTAMKMLKEARRPDIAILAGKIGVKSGRDDRYPESIHKLHLELGRLLLDSDDNDTAWEHLLSAAFGLPEDGHVNLELGHFYEKVGRYRRAMSRFVQAVVVPESGPQAIAGLERVQEKLGGERLSVDLVDKMVQGRVHNFSAATKYEEPEDPTTRCVLAELFTNPHFGRQRGETWESFAVGGAMAAEGLLSHFPRNRCVVLSYHIDVPEPCALQNELGMHTAMRYGYDRPVYFRINGVGEGPGAERWRQGEQAFEQNRQLVVDELAFRTKYALTGNVRVEDGAVRGTITATGPRKRNLMLQVVLAERGVLYPGKAVVVVHRMVARAALTGDLNGIPYDPKERDPKDNDSGDAAMTFTFDKQLDEIEAANVAYLEEYEASGNPGATRLSTKIDPEQVVVIAFLREKITNLVQQAAQFDPESASDESSQTRQRLETEDK